MEKTEKDIMEAYNWALGVILEAPTVKRRADPALWRCSICREQVSPNIIEMVNGMPVCWHRIDQNALNF